MRYETMKHGENRKRCRHTLNFDIVSPKVHRTRIGFASSPFPITYNLNVDCLQVMDLVHIGAPPFISRIGVLHCCSFLLLDSPVSRFLGSGFHCGLCMHTMYLQCIFLPSPLWGRATGDCDVCRVSGLPLDPCATQPRFMQIMTPVDLGLFVLLSPQPSPIHFLRWRFSGFGLQGWALGAADGGVAIGMSDIKSDANLCCVVLSFSFSFFPPSVASDHSLIGIDSRNCCKWQGSLAADHSSRARLNPHSSPLVPAFHFSFPLS